MNEEINRLNFENFIWITFASLCILNINGDNLEKEYIQDNNEYAHNKANKIFEFTLTITLLIYIYFFLRNYRALKKEKQQKKLYEIKLLGSTLLIAGIICLIYFQKKQRTFSGSPAL